MKQCLIISVLVFFTAIVSGAAEMGQATGDAPRATRLVEKAEGRVNVSRVNLRSGPATTFSIIITVKKDAVLTVKSWKDGWYEVELPQGSSCWVYKDYLKVDFPEGGINPEQSLAGEITGSNVRLRAAPDMLSNVLAERNKGDKVDVFGKVGDWYRLRPPKGSTGWISAKYVDIPEDERVSGEPLPGEASRIKDILPTDDFAPLPTIADGGIPSMPMPGNTSDLLPLSDLGRAEHMMAQELKKAPLDRNFSEAISLYNKVLTSTMSTDEEKKASKARLRQIFTLTPRKELASYMLDLSRQVEAELKKTEQRYRGQLESFRSKLPPSRYTARGILYPVKTDVSTARYRLKMGDVNVYLLKSPPRRYDTYIGKEVGVTGTILPPPPGFDIEIIDVASIEPTSR